MIPEQKNLFDQLGIVIDSIPIVIITSLYVDKLVFYTFFFNSLYCFSRRLRRFEIMKVKVVRLRLVDDNIHDVEIWLYNCMNQNHSSP